MKYCLVFCSLQVTSPQAFEGLRNAGRPVRRPDCTLVSSLLPPSLPHGSASFRRLPPSRPLATRMILATPLWVLYGCGPDACGWSRPCLSPTIVASPADLCVSTPLCVWSPQATVDHNVPTDDRSDFVSPETFISEPNSLTQCVTLEDNVKVSLHPYITRTRATYMYICMYICIYVYMYTYINQPGACSPNLNPFPP